MRFLLTGAWPLMLHDLCIYTTHSLDDLRIAHTRGGAGTCAFRGDLDETRRLLDAAQDAGRRLPVVFAPPGVGCRVIAWAVLDAISAGPNPTCTFSGLRLFEVGPSKSAFVRAADGRPLYEYFRGAFAVCRTPDFLREPAAPLGRAAPEPGVCQRCCGRHAEVRAYGYHAYRSVSVNKLFERQVTPVHRQATYQTTYAGLVNDSAWVCADCVSAERTLRGVLLALAVLAAVGAFGLAYAIDPRFVPRIFHDGWLALKVVPLVLAGLAALGFAWSSVSALRRAGEQVAVRVGREQWHSRGYAAVVPGHRHQGPPPGGTCDPPACNDSSPAVSEVWSV